MEQVKWLEVTVNTTPERLEELSARLINAGITGLVVEDEAEFHRFLEQNRKYWDYVDDELLEQMRGVSRLKFYVTDDEDGKAKLRTYAALLDTEYAVVPLEDDDWAYSWQKYYRPFCVGKRLYIVPQWLRAEAVPEGRTPVYLNPGLTFGSGSHASTQLCLAGLEKYVTQGCTVLDLGCGSGILSIAALVLGAEHAAAVDIDPMAVGVAYENAELNQIGKDRYAVCSGDILADRTILQRLGQERYDVVLANIVADVIIPLSAVAPQLMKDEGVFICSGIIDTRAAEVEAAIRANGLRVIERTEQDGWVSLTARKK